MALEFGRLKD
jgi:hypothetical protein